MAGRGWADWFEREEFIGQISDMRVQNLQVEREVVQKRTFTRWINLHLEKCEPPIEVEDLFQDIQDGYVLLALLEELSGCKLLHGFKKSSHRIFRLNNIAKVLSFLEERNVKLVSIDAADVADGNASIILGLIWNIILFFQIKELTGNIRSQFPSSCSLSSIPTSTESDTAAAEAERRATSAATREHTKAIRKLLQWVQKRTRRFGVAVQDFGRSWTSGLAFLAVIKSIDPSLVDMRKALLRPPRENLEEAFRTAHYSLGIPRLLEPEDVSLNAPDEQSIITYVSQFLEHFPGLEEPKEPVQMMERSVSLCLLNLRHADSEHRSNGAQGSRVKERSSRFQRDCEQAPPKILISSAGGRGPRPARPATSRSWSTEDFRSEPSPDEGLSSAGLLDSLEDSSQRTDAQSPASSSLAESGAADSAIGSPDGWRDSDFSAAPEKFSESSWCESGPAWEVYRAVPVQISTLDEGFALCPDGGPPEEQWCADEGIYSLSSLESAQEQGPSLAMEPGEPVRQKEIRISNHSQDVPKAPASGGGGLQPEAGGQQVATRRANEEQPPEAAEQGGDGQDHHQETTSPAENRTAAKDADPDGDGEAGGQEGEETAETFEDEGRLKPQGGTSEGLLREPEVLQDLADPVQESEEPPGPSASAAIPLISVSSELEEQDQEQDPEKACDPEGGHPAGLEELHRSQTAGSSGSGVLEEAGRPSVPAGPCPVESPSCPAAEEAQHRGADPEWGPPGGNDLATLPTAQTTPERDQGEVRQGCEPPPLHGPDSAGTSPALGTPLGPEVTGEDRPEDDGGETHSFGSGLPASFPHTDPLHADVDESSPTDDLAGDPLEPMDLFYPDKDEAVFSEPPEAEPEAWPSVLSVSALQPAPASQLVEDQPLDPLAHDSSSRNGENLREMRVEHLGFSSSLLPAETNQEADEAPDPQEQHSPSAERTGGLWRGVEAGQQISRSAREKAELLSGSGWSEELPIAPVLRHRKGPLFAQENPDAATQQAGREEGRDGATPELYLLLLLWLLLYCFWLLPQMEVKMLPKLLLNL